MTALDELYMRRCLELARLGQGKTHPNPMVGCVVLDREGRVVGEGFHPQLGGPHAEVVALEQAGEKAQGGTLYVSLEPCSHVGKTPPCVDKVLASGVRTVICGMRDPNPKVAGSGISTLQEKGITVHTGVLEAECQRLNEAFIHFIQHRQPFVVLKMAMTLDGKIATRSGESQWISGPLARRWVHGLRSESDGILTTAETVLRDNSRLTVREVPLLGRPPVRIVMDRQQRLDPAKAPIFQPVPEGGPVWVFTRKGGLETAYLQKLTALGGELFEVGETGQGLDLTEVFQALGERGITQLLVEAGGRLAGTLLNENRIHKLWLVYGDQILADPSAKPGFLGGPLFQLNNAPRFEMGDGFKLENNWILEAYPR